MSEKNTYDEWEKYSTWPQSKVGVHFLGLLCILVQWWSGSLSAQALESIFLHWCSGESQFGHCPKSYLIFSEFIIFWIFPCFWGGQQTTPLCSCSITPLQEDLWSSLERTQKAEIFSNVSCDHFGNNPKMISENGLWKQKQSKAESKAERSDAGWNRFDK